MSDNAALIRGLYEAFASGDVGTVLGAFDEKIEWNEAEHNPYATGEPWIGTQEVVDRLFVKLAAEWEGFTIHPEEIVNTDTGVLVLARYSGTYTSTGRPLDAQVAHIWDIRDGKITRFRQYTDTYTMREVMGV